MRRVPKWMAIIVNYFVLANCNLAYPKDEMEQCTKIKKKTECRTVWWYQVTLSNCIFWFKQYIVCRSSQHMRGWRSVVYLIEQLFFIRQLILVKVFTFTFQCVFIPIVSKLMQEIYFQLCIWHSLSGVNHLFFPLVSLTCVPFKKWFHHFAI